MHLTDGGLLSLTVRDVADFRRCEWGWLRQLEVDLAGGYPAPPVDEPIRVLMAKTGVEHTARVHRFLTQRFPDIHELQTPISELSLVEEASAIARPEWVWREPQHPLELTARADALIHTGDGWRILLAALGHSRMRNREFMVVGGATGLRVLGLETGSSWDIAFADGEYATRPLPPADGWMTTLDSLSAMAQQWREGKLSTDWWETSADQCGRLSCAWCVDALGKNDDLFHTSRLRRSHRRVLKAHGIHTMRQLVESSTTELVQRIPGIEPDTLHELHRQARLQVSSTSENPPRLTSELVDRPRLEALKTPEPFDLYLDFEGDPSHYEWDPRSAFQPGAEGPGSWLGIEYLIGVVDSAAETYESWWSDSFEEEGVQFRLFIDFVTGRLSEYPQMTIYHYAGYEQVALQRLAKRHGYGESLVNKLIEQGVLVDLYREVMATVAIGTPSYSLKKLEPLYFDGTERSAIRGGAESVLAFSDYRATLGLEKEALKTAIIDYNRVDCLSTKRLHQWLVGRRGASY